MKNLLLGLLLLSIISCSSETKDVDEKIKEEKTTENFENKISNVISLSGNDEMKFDQIEFKVKAGEKVVLTFKNAGVLPIETMGHNVIVLEKDVDVSKFANAAAKSKETDYIPTLYQTDMVAYTKLLGPGESQTIEFTLKEPGDYTFICSFPGHWIAMKGVINAIN